MIEVETIDFKFDTYLRSDSNKLNIDIFYM